MKSANEASSLFHFLKIVLNSWIPLSPLRFHINFKINIFHLFFVSDNSHPRGVMLILIPTIYLLKVFFSFFILSVSEVGKFKSLLLCIYLLVHILWSCFIRCTQNVFLSSGGSNTFFFWKSAMSHGNILYQATFYISLFMINIFLSFAIFHRSFIISIFFLNPIWQSLSSLCTFNVILIYLVLNISTFSMQSNKMKVT